MSATPIVDRVNCPPVVDPNIARCKRFIILLAIALVLLPRSPWKVIVYMLLAMAYLYIVSNGKAHVAAPSTTATAAQHQEDKKAL